MKKSTTILIAVGIAAFVGSAVAQDNSNDQPTPPPPPVETAAVAAPVEAAAAPATEAAPPPAELVAAVQAAADAATPPTEPVAETTTDNNKERTSTSIQPSQPLGSSRPKVVSRFTPPESAVTNANPNDLNINFKNAPMDMVLNYLSDAAGFIIILDTRVAGTVSISGKHLTKDEAVDLLNSVLNKNGFAAIRSGRTLTIVDKNDAKTRNIPVKTGNDPKDVPNNDEIVTQIIPIRFVDARQLVSDMSSFASPQATVVANEAGNSIVVTDTQANIKHLLEIIRAVDNSAEAETEIRVFRLKYASPQDVATELSSIFPSSSTGGTQTPVRFGGGFGGGGPGGFFSRMMGGAGGAGGSSSSSSDRVKKATAVTAVADARIQAVIVTAPKDMMDQIAGMMTDLDVASNRDQKVFVLHLENADPDQAATVLQGMFQGNNSRSSSSSQNSALQQRAVNNANTTSSSSSSSGFGTGSTGGGRSGGGRSF
jgi:type II secretory pathway component GspD/PulD (secretin)